MPTRLARFCLFSFPILLLLAVCPVYGQWMTQTHVLHVGYNAIYVHETVPETCEVLFSNTPVTQVAWFNAKIKGPFAAGFKDVLPRDMDWLYLE